MRYRLPLAALVLGSFLPTNSALAGAVDNKSNLGADWVRMPSRNAVTNSVDAVAYNPAGVTKLPEGAYFNLSNQTIHIDLAHEAGSGVSLREFPSKNIVPLVPGLYMLYRRGDWAAYGSFNIPAGGGTLDYPHGSHTTAAMEEEAARVLNLSDPSDLGLQTKVASAYYGGVVGGAYAINEMLSVSLAARYIKATRHILMTSDASLVASLVQTDTLADQEESAAGYGGIIGLSVTPMRNLNLSLRYESKVALEWHVDQSDIPVALLGMLSDASRARLRSKLPAEGTDYPRDLPAYAALGAAYRVIADLELSWSFNYYFQKQADWNGLEDYHHDAWDMGVGGELRATPELLLSLGVLVSDSGVKHRGYLVENPALPSIAPGLGGKYEVFDGFGVNLGVMYAYYLPDTYWPEGAPAVDLTRKRALIGSLGVEWKFL